jgi:hypothetical protein
LRTSTEYLAFSTLSQQQKCQAPGRHPHLVTVIPVADFETKPLNHHADCFGLPRSPPETLSMTSSTRRRGTEKKKCRQNYTKRCCMPSQTRFPVQDDLETSSAAPASPGESRLELMYDERQALRQDGLQDVELEDILLGGGASGAYFS